MQNTDPNAQSAQPVTLDETVRRMQLEILHYVVAGHVPRTVSSIGELSDFRDANTYGGFSGDDPRIDIKRPAATQKQELALPQGWSVQKLPGWLNPWHVLDANGKSRYAGPTKKQALNNALPDVGVLLEQQEKQGPHEGFVDFMGSALARVDTWLINGGLERESLPGGWTLADDQTQDAYDPWGYKSEKPLYLLKVREEGVPTLDLTVLQDGDSFIGVHGDVKLDRCNLPRQAAEQAARWALDNGWSADVMQRAQWPDTKPLSAESLQTTPLSIQGGLATAVDGEVVNLLKVQAACNYAFQELGDMEFADAADAMSKLTGMYQGPHGDWFLNADTQCMRPVEVPEGEFVSKSRTKAQEPVEPLAETLFIAGFESRSFSFTALGRSELEARQAIKNGLDAHSAKLGLDAEWWSMDDVNVDACPIGGCLRDHSLLAVAGVTTQSDGRTQSALRVQRNTLRTDSVFSDAPEPEGMHWRNLCALENKLATMLLARPGAFVSIDTDAWVLRESDEGLVLKHAILTPDGLTDETSRFDFDLEWVDYEADELQASNALLSQAIDEFDQRVSLENAIPHAKGSPENCVSEGNFIGAVLKVEGGVLTQRVSRAGDTVLHDVSRLNSVPQVGTVAEIRYRQGRGDVGGQGTGKGLDR